MRRAWLKLHRWVALGLGWLLVMAGFLGALLTVAKPLDHWSHPELFAQPAAAEAATGTSLDDVRRQLQQEFGPAATYTFRPPRAPAQTLWVYVGGPWEGVVYFDSAAREVGRRGETQGAYNLLFELHSSLLFGETGKAVLATAAATYLFLLVTGLVLWWPRRWPPRLRIRWREGASRALPDLHNTAGALLGLLIAVSVASGAYMAWPPLRTLVSSLAGDAAVKAPQGHGTAIDATPLLDQLVQKANSLFPDAMVGYVQVPGSTTQPVRVRLKLADDPHPNGLTSVWLDPGSGEVLKVARWSELDAGNRLVSFVYPLHTGALGGPVHQVLVGITGLALATLGGSGLLLWWTRTRASARRSVRSRASGHASR